MTVFYQVKWRPNLPSEARGPAVYSFLKKRSRNLVKLQWNVIKGLGVLMNSPKR